MRSNCCLVSAVLKWVRSMSFSWECVNLRTDYLDGSEPERKDNPISTKQLTGLEKNFLTASKLCERDTSEDDEDEDVKKETSILRKVKLTGMSSGVGDEMEAFGRNL